MGASLIDLGTPIFGGGWWEVAGLMSSPAEGSRTSFGVGYAEQEVLEVALARRAEPRTLAI